MTEQNKTEKMSASERLVDEWLNTYESAHESADNIDPEFREKVRPSMNRLFSQIGRRLTDEKYLIIMFSEHLINRHQSSKSLRLIHRLKEQNDKAFKHLARISPTGKKNLKKASNLPKRIKSRRKRKQWYHEHLIQ